MSANYEAGAGSSTDRSATKGQATRSLSEQSGRVFEEVQELGRTAMSSVSDAASQLRDKGQAALESGRDRAADAKREFDRYVGDNPAKSVLIALGVGALVGYLIRRRSV